MESALSLQSSDLKLTLFRKRASHPNLLTYSVKHGLWSLELTTASVKIALEQNRSLPGSRGCRHPRKNTNRRCPVSNLGAGSDRLRRLVSRETRPVDSGLTLGDCFLHHGLVAVGGGCRCRDESVVDNLLRFIHA
ncbi:hypothetical protein EVAR_54350_1 [Eumeta japonica]|uniref:Uncharacterized protein n=1 Tax=Eumeta variegata TaxID=151549 RepID=A0A4C1Z878_EUMVA|nr:hypothetical protein EVAR_54350_1 [Eumeta japonica]